MQGREKLIQIIRPRVVVSRCIEFDPCRYNGQIISSEFVRKLKRHVDFVPVCPEFEIGLGVPRNSVRLVSREGEIRLVQPKTRKDVTQDMCDFAQNFLETQRDVDGFILKASSPTCGIKNTKLYPNEGKVASISRTEMGLFGKAVLMRYPDIAIEDEGRIRNPRIKEHFLTKLFILARFREMKTSPQAKDLIEFHTENKLLFMSYNQSEMKIMGKIVANHEHRSIFDLIEDYEPHLLKTLSKPPRYTSNINVLMHVLGYFSDKLNDKEKALFLDSLERYREGKITICPVITFLKSWVARFDEDYLKNQTFFEPYPQDMIEIDPSSAQRGRDMW